MPKEMFSFTHVLMESDGEKEDMDQHVVQVAVIW